MNFVKKFASIVFGLLIVLALGLFLTARSFDLNKYKPYVEGIVQREIGRKLVINGEAEIGISLIPTVVVNDVELANAEWATQPQMIKAKQIKVKFALMPLLKKQVVIDEVLLASPEIYLEKSGDKNNWTFGSAYKVESADNKSATEQDVRSGEVLNNPLLAGFAAHEVLIENGVLQYIDGKNIQDIKINKIAVEIPSIDEKIALNFDVVHNGNKINGEGIFGSINDLLENEKAFPVLLNMSAYNADIKLNGSVVGIMTNTPQYAFESNIYNPASNLGVPEITLISRVDGDINGLTADVSTLNVANNLITGAVEVKWNGKLPWIKANLKSDKFNLESLQPSSPMAWELPMLINEAQALNIPDDKVPYQVLQLVNADVMINIKKLIVNSAMQADNVSINAKLNNGVLNANPIKFTFGGGELVGKLMVNALQQRVEFDVNSRNLKLQNLHSEFAISRKSDFGVISGGDTDLYIKGSSNGATYKQLVNNLNGNVVGIVGKSVMQTGGLEFLKGNIISQLLNVLKIDTQKSSQLDLTCAVVRADISKGKMLFPRGIAFDSKQLTVVGDGKINLINDSLDFSIEPSMNKLASGNVTQALASFIKLGGTIDNPKIGIDNKEAIKTIIGVAATGGVSYLGSQVFLNGDGSPCYTALEGTSYASRFPKPTGVKATTKNVVDDTQKHLKQGLKDLKNTAKDIFNSFKK